MMGGRAREEREQEGDGLTLLSRARPLRRQPRRSSSRPGPVAGPHPPALARRAVMTKASPAAGAVQEAQAAPATRTRRPRRRRTRPREGQRRQPRRQDEGRGRGRRQRRAARRRRSQTAPRRGRATPKGSLRSASRRPVLAMAMRWPREAERLATARERPRDVHDVRPRLGSGLAMPWARERSARTPSDAKRSLEALDPPGRSQELASGEIWAERRREARHGQGAAGRRR